MPELQVHAASDKSLFEQRASPRRALDVHLHRLRTEGWMAAKQRRSLAATYQFVDVIAGLDLDRRAGGQIGQINTAFDFGLHDLPVGSIAEVRTRGKQL